LDRQWTSAACPGNPPKVGPLSFLLAVLLAWPAPAFAAVTFPLRWRWSNPRPHGNNVVDMAYSDTLGLAVQVAERGQLYTSVDFDLWLPRESGTTLALRAVTFFGTRIVVTGESGTVLYADAPDSFHAGQLIGGPTTDWLEAVCAAPSLLVAVGDRGAIYTSTNGVAWKRQANPESSPHWLLGVAAGNGNFVAVGEAGTILTSANGTNWTKRSSGSSLNLNRVAFGYNTYTAVGDNGMVLVSTNGGLQWQTQNPLTGATRSLFNASYRGTDRLLVGDSEVRLCDLGVWSDELAKTNGPPAWTYYSTIGRPSFFFIAGRTGMMAEGYQVNLEPYFWLQTAPSFRSWLFDVCWSSNLYVAVGDYASVLTSGNGVDWTQELVPDSVTNAVFLGVGGTTNLLVAAGNQGSLMVSTNGWTNLVTTNATGNVTTQTVSTIGVIWQAVQPRPTTNDLQGVAWFNNQYVVAGDQGLVLTSPDGTAWASQATPTSKLLSCLTASPGLLVATGDDGALITSPDATQWTARVSSTTNWLYRVRYLNGAFITVGQNGTVLTSPDGTNWTAGTSGTSAWLYDVAWIDGTWFAFGAQGTLLSSDDAVTWTNRGTITAKALYAAATDSRQLITVGVEGVILRSPVIPDLAPIDILDFSHSTSTNGATSQNLFLFGGQTDQRFTLDYRAAFDTNVWVSGPGLEILDGSGTLLYLESFAATNAPPKEFYRATLLR
jgi:hypothetical protein